MSWSFILYTNTSHDMRCIGEMREFYPKKICRNYYNETNIRGSNKQCNTSERKRK